MQKTKVNLDNIIYQYIQFDIFKKPSIVLLLTFFSAVITIISFYAQGRFVAIPGLFIVIAVSIIFGMWGAVCSTCWLIILLLNTIYQVQPNSFAMNLTNPYLLSFLAIFLIALALGKSSEIIADQRKELSYSKKRFNSVVQTQKEMICRFKPDTTLTFVNDAYCSQFGLEKEELLGKKFIKLIPEEDHAGVYEKINNINSDNPTQTYSHKVFYGENKIAYQEWTDYGIFGEDDNLIEIQSVGRDITAEKKAEKKLKEAKEEIEKAKNRYQGMLESQNDLIVRVDSDSKFTYVNDAYCEAFGKSRDELLGSSFQPLVHPDDIEKTMKAMEGLYSPPNRIYVEQRAKTVNGWRWIAWEDYAIKNNEGEIVEIQGVGRDITELKMAQKDAEKANKMKSLFLANITHEIRTPLNVIIGFTEVLEDEKLNEEQQEYLNSIKLAGDSLLSLINDILDISKIESDVFEVKNEFINLQQTAEEVKSILNDKIVKKGLEFKTELCCDDYLVNFDKDILRRILINLINNAFKFTKRGFIKLEIKSELSEKEEDYTNIKIIVEDTGIGIESDKQENIFEPFTQLENKEINYKGTGLGLTITKRLVEQLGGSINLISEKGKGSRFILEFKKKEIRKGKSAEEVFNLDIDVEDYAVLIVDDEELNRELLRIKLEKRGFEVEEAQNGIEALNKTLEISPDLILMDLKMPKEDGYSAIAKIKEQVSADKISSDIKIIALSAAATKEEKEKAFKVGFNDFIAKPITRQKLDNIFSKYI